MTAAFDIDNQLAKIKNFAEALSAMADGLRRHPLPGSFGGSTYYVDIEVWDPETSTWGTIDEATVAAYVREMKAINGSVEKEMSESIATYRVRFPVEGMSSWTAPQIVLNVTRETVCTPIVVGTERKTVTKYVAVEVEEDVDVVEWDCRPLLAQVDS